MDMLVQHPRQNAPHLPPVIRDSTVDPHRIQLRLSKSVGYTKALLPALHRWVVGHRGPPTQPSHALGIRRLSWAL